MTESALPEWTVIGFTGHRNLNNSAAAAQGVRAAVERLAAAYAPLAAISSAAKGADTLFVEEVVRRNLPLLLVLPFHAARFEKDFQPSEWQRVLPILQNALQVEEICEVSGDDNESYMECGMPHVDREDVMLPVSERTRASGRGGTGDVSAYERGLDKPLLG